MFFQGEFSMKYTCPNDVKVLFLGTPEIAVQPLLGLLEAGFDVVGVVCQEDKVTGRGHDQIEMPPVKKLALKANLPVFQPHRIKNDFKFAKKLNFDVIVCMAYGQIVPMEFVSLAPKGAINLHGSLLPKLRGAAPIQRAIMNGDEKSGITLMEMAEKMDSGKMYDRRELSIESEDNYDSLTKKLGELAKKVIVEDLLLYVNDELKGVEQDEKEVTFAKKILSEDEHLPLNLSALEMNRYIRALANKPGAYVIFRDKKLKIYSTSQISNFSVDPCHVKCIKGKLYLGTKEGTLLLKEVQYEGKKRMDAGAFANGARLNQEGEKVE